MAGIPLKDWSGASATDDLHNTIRRLSDQNAITQYCVIALTVASLIGSAVQVWYAYKADRRAEVEAAAVIQRHSGSRPAVSGVQHSQAPPVRVESSTPTAASANVSAPK